MGKRTLFNAIRFIFHPWDFLYKAVLRIPHLVPDTVFLQIKYRSNMGTWINLDKPRTFTEKINWLKINDRKSIYTTMVDKYAVKEYVSSIIGNNYIIPLLGVWESPEQIDWDTLPDRFVLKTTHGGGSSGVIVCLDKSRFNKENAVAKLHKALISDIYLYYREWPYKNVPKRIIAEKYICENNRTSETDLTDYKFFCFNGEPLYCQVIRNRNTKETIDFYDMEWNHMPFIGLVPMFDKSLYGNGYESVSRPLKLEEMKKIAKLLSKSIPFLRVDLYYVNNRVYFGETTFFPASGIGTFVPEEWNLKLGELIDLSIVRKEDLS